MLEIGLRVYLNCPPLSDFCFWKGLFIPIMALIVFLLCIGGVVVVGVILSGNSGGLTVVGPFLALLLFPKLFIDCGQDRGCLSPIGDLSLGSAFFSYSFFDLVLDLGLQNSSS